MTLQERLAQLRKYYETDEARKIIRLFDIPAGLKGIARNDGDFALAIPTISEAKEIDAAKFTITHYCSTGRIDHAMDCLRPQGMNAEPLIKNGGNVFYNHKWSGAQDLPIGRSMWQRATKQGVLCQTEYHVNEYAFAADVFRLAAKGALRSYSVSMIPKEWDIVCMDDLLKLVAGEFDIPNIAEYDPTCKVMYHKNWTCFEYSQVGVPMNMDATVKGLLQHCLTDGTVQTDFGKDIVGAIVGRENLGDVELKEYYDDEQSVLASLDAECPDCAEKASQKMSVQSVLCSKKRFKTEKAAAKWVTDHGFKNNGVDETDEYYRYRQFPPGDCESGSDRTISLTNGVKAVTCKRKGKSLEGTGIEKSVTDMQQTVATLQRDLERLSEVVATKHQQYDAILETEEKDNHDPQTSVETLGKTSTVDGNALIARVLAGDVSRNNGDR